MACQCTHFSIDVVENFVQLNVRIPVLITLSSRSNFLGEKKKDEFSVANGIQGQVSHTVRYVTHGLFHRNQCQFVTSFESYSNYKFTLN